MTVKQAYTASARMMEMTQVKNPFIPFSLKGFVRNSSTCRPAIHNIGAKHNMKSPIMR